MKYSFSILVIFLLSLLPLSSCKKDNDDEFFIEATINGSKWRGKSTGDFMATRSDNSQMKIFIDSSVQVSSSFNFFTDDMLDSFYDSSAEFELGDGYLAPFDSKLRLKWN